ncbi:putative reverse transcriptase domain, reverse transcriptase zinc-binding domain protein [Tanacetum coccineum]
MEVSAEKELMKSIVVSIPLSNEKGHTLAKVDVEYEWNPPRCTTCRIFDHNSNACPKLPKKTSPVDTTVEAPIDGFIEVKKKKNKNKQPHHPKHIDGIRLGKPSSLHVYYPPLDKVKRDDDNGMEDGTPKSVGVSMRVIVRPDRNLYCILEPNLTLRTSNLQRCVLVWFRHWDWTLMGVFAPKVVKRLKLLKKPLRKLLYEKGNLHDNVKRLCDELDRVQTSLDADPFNVLLRESEATCVAAFSEALIMEERFLKQNAKIDWLREGDINSAYFFKAVKSRVSHSRIDVVTGADGTIFVNNNVPDAFVSHYEHFLGLPGATSGFNTDSLKLLVSQNQSAFVPGRSIADNILLTQELMHNYHLDRGSPRCAFKVDIQKAYDTVDWGFLKEVLIGFGFHDHSGVFSKEPVSFPILFTLVMEILTLMLHRRVSNTTEFVYQRYCANLELINLCFADDLFLFMNGDVDSDRIIKNALEEFKDASGLVLSLPKSTAYFCNVLKHTKVSILNILPFEEGRLLIKYLGVPLVSSSLIFWDCFLWCQGSMRKGRAKVAWDVVCLPKDEGGLGVHRLDLFIKALMFDKWSYSCPLVNFISTREIYRTRLDTSAKVSDVVQNGAWQWPPYLLDKYPFLGSMTILNINVGSMDKLVWHNELGVVKPFTVNHVSSSMRPRNQKVDWYAMLWFPFCIPRHAFHLWLVVKEKLKTQDRVGSWEVSNSLARLCPLCDLQPDSHQHLFFDCHFSQQVWSHVKSFIVRKAYLLEDKQIPSVGIFDEKMRIMVGDGVTLTCDGIRTYKGWRQDPIDLRSPRRFGGVTVPAFGKHLEEKHVTWARSGEKRDKIQDCVFTGRGEGVRIYSDAVNVKERRHQGSRQEEAHRRFDGLTTFQVSQPLDFLHLKLSFFKGHWSFSSSSKAMPFPLSAILRGGVGENSDKLELNRTAVNCSKGMLSKVIGPNVFRAVEAGMG